MFDRSKSDFHSASANGEDVLAEAVRNPSPDKVRGGPAGKIVPKQITVAEHGRARLDHSLADSGIDTTDEWEDVDSQEEIEEDTNLSVSGRKPVRTSSSLQGKGCERQRKYGGNDRGRPRGCKTTFDTFRERDP